MIVLIANGNDVNIALLIPVAARLRNLRSDDTLSKGHPMPIKQGLEL